MYASSIGGNDQSFHLKLVPVVFSSKIKAFQQGYSTGEQVDLVEKFLKSIITMCILNGKCCLEKISMHGRGEFIFNVQRTSVD